MASDRKSITWHGGGMVYATDLKSVARKGIEGSSPSRAIDRKVLKWYN